MSAPPPHAVGPTGPGLAEWEGEDVGVAEIAARLGPLREQATGGLSQALASVLNLIAWAPEPDEGAREEELIEGLADHQPSRVVIVSPDARGGGGGIRAHVETRCSTVGSGGGVCVELIRLALGAEVIPHAASAVVPLLRSDLPTYLWWPAEPDAGSAAFRGLAELSDRMLTEAGRTAPGPQAARALAAHVAERISRVTDLAWAAITPWRQLTVQMLDPAGLARLQEGPSTLLAMHCGTEPTLEALLYAGWLREVVGDALTVRTQPADEGEDAVAAIELVGPTGARLRVDRIFASNAATVTTSVDGEARRRTLPLPHRDRGALLAGELEYQGRDRAFERAVARAAELTR